MAKNDFMKYRQDGFLFVSIFLNGKRTIEDLEREIRLRKETGVTVNLPFDELNANEGTKVMREFIYQGQDIVSLYVLRKYFDFGKKRLSRNLHAVFDESEEKVEYVYLGAKRHSKRLEEILKVKDRFHAEDPDFKGRQPKGKVLEYITERDNGIEQALRMVREEGRMSIERRLTKNTHYLQKMADAEIDWTNVKMRAHFNEFRITSWLIALNHNEGFGNDRLNQFMDGFEEVYGRIERNELGFENLYRELKDNLDCELPIGYLNCSDCFNWDFVPQDTKVAEIGSDGLKQAIVYRLDIIRQRLEEEKSKAIVEPDEYNANPCINYCKDKAKCKAQGYKSKCTCWQLYREVMRERMKEKRGA